MRLQTGVGRTRGSRQLGAAAAAVVAVDWPGAANSGVPAPASQLAPDGGTELKQRLVPAEGERGATPPMKARCEEAYAPAILQASYKAR